jgi:hypothetical protein|tara:strand:+ start:75 stop:209 length:135 start_codon:yes stop_codon:yes gene_type:complete
MKAQQMLVLTNMLAKIISDMDDLKAMIKEVVNDEFQNNYEGEEE